MLGRGGDNNAPVAAGAEPVGDQNISLNGLRVDFGPKPDWESKVTTARAFGPDGTMWIALGERMNPEPRQLAQLLGATFGKVVRLEPDGIVARQAVDRRAGPKGGDAFTIPLAGKNYGWPVIGYGEEYSGEPVGEGQTARAWSSRSTTGTR